MAGFLTLKKSNCKNCYKCIRHCPVKAIRFSGNQAHIIGNECILCGQCFVVCPQNAKEIVDGIEKVKVLMQGKKTEGGYYVYTKEAGKSSMADGQSNPLTSVLAGQFQSCVDAVAKAAKAGDMTLGESADFTLTAQLKAGYDKLTKSGADYTYFVYAIEAKTLTKGDGDYEGATTLGLIEYKLADGATAYIAIDR